MKIDLLCSLLCTKDVMTCNVVSKGYLNSQFFSILLRIENETREKKDCEFFRTLGSKNI